MYLLLQDLAKDTAPYFRKAVKFYNTVAEALVTQGHTFDMFMAALDQVELISSMHCFLVRQARNIFMLFLPFRLISSYFCFLVLCGLCDLIWLESSLPGFTAILGR